MHMTEGESGSTHGTLCWYH